MLRGSMTVMLVLAAAFGCTRPLPEEGTPAAALYQERCGSCHRAYPPSSLKFALWEMVLPRMETRMRELGRPPLSEEQRMVIVDYLRRNS